jgi:hypothetical protein
MQKKGWSGGVAHVVECLPSKCEALSSNPITEKKKEEENALSNIHCYIIRATVHNG